MFVYLLSHKTLARRHHHWQYPIGLQTPDSPSSVRGTRHRGYGSPHSRQQEKSPKLILRRQSRYRAESFSSAFITGCHIDLSRAPFTQADEADESSVLPPTSLTPSSGVGAVRPQALDVSSVPKPRTIQATTKQSRWSPGEDALINDLRGRGMKWEDISTQLPGRSAISCRLHYQNYLERRSEWSKERKDKLAHLYERFKADMWAKVAEELGVPWRAAEAMHWQLGEGDMARRIGVASHDAMNPQGEITYGEVIMLAPIQKQIYRAQGYSLPGIKKVTEGLPPYTTPIFPY